MTSTVAAIIWVIGIFVWAAIRLPRERVARRTKVVTDKRSTWERIALTLCGLGLVVLPAITLATNWLDFADLPFQPFAAWFGTFTMIAFLALFYATHKQMGKNWSVSLELREGHKLLTDGLYKYVRHPMYSSFWLWGIAQMLLIPNWIGGLAGIVSVAILYYSRVAKEEDMMRAQFGQEYDDYCERTPRIFPQIL